MSRDSPWNKGDKVMVTFEVSEDAEDMPINVPDGMRLVTLVGDNPSYYYLPESCFVERSAYEFVEDPTAGHDDWNG